MTEMISSRVPPGPLMPSNFRRRRTNTLRKLRTVRQEMLDLIIWFVKLNPGRFKSVPCRYDGSDAKFPAFMLQLRGEFTDYFVYGDALYSVIPESWWKRVWYGKRRRVVLVPPERLSDAMLEKILEALV